MYLVWHVKFGTGGAEFSGISGGWSSTEYMRWQT